MDNCLEWARLGVRNASSQAHDPARRVADVEESVAWVENEIERCQSKDQGKLFVTMRDALGLLMEHALLDIRFEQFPTPTGQLTSWELCTSCEDRIERHHRRGFASQEKDRILRVYFPLQPRYERRKLWILGAWQIARDDGRFASKFKFAEYASGRVGLSTRTILQYLQELPPH